MRYKTVSGVLTTLKDIYIACRGFHTNRHLLVIESDDWGSIRVPSYDTFCYLQKCGEQLEKDAFLRNDSLETENDLMALYNVLSSVCDKNGNPAVMTANFVMGNPDFDSIDISNGKYAFEFFYDTYKKYNKSADTLNIVKLGIEKKVFYPQLHCREHLNVNRWMQALQKKQADATLAFENKMIGVFSSFSPNNIFGYMDAFNTDLTTNDELKHIFLEAAKIFENTFGYKSKTFVASCFVWADEFEKVLADYGIVGIQSEPWQNRAVGKDGKYQLKRKIHYTGQRNGIGGVFTVRNCRYEPAYLQNVHECVDECFCSICRSFDNKKPAIINSHRFNYISTINPNNAIHNLLGLKELLAKIKNKYPDIEFITTPQLVDIIAGRKYEQGT